MLIIIDSSTCSAAWSQLNSILGPVLIFMHNHSNNFLETVTDGCSFTAHGNSMTEYYYIIYAWMMTLYAINDINRSTHALLSTTLLLYMHNDNNIIII